MNGFVARKDLRSSQKPRVPQTVGGREQHTTGGLRPQHEPGSEHQSQPLGVIFHLGIPVGNVNGGGGDVSQRVEKACMQTRM